MNLFGRIALGLLYAAVPIVGWVMLYNSFKRVKSDEIAMIQHWSGKTELIEEGLYFRPFPGDSFSESFSKALDYINFGPLQRLRVNASQIAYKTIGNGTLELLTPSIHIIDASKNETFNVATEIKSNQDDYIDFGSKKIVRIRPGTLGVKTNIDGHYEELDPRVHTIDTAKGETFDPGTGVQDIGQDDFRLGNHRYVTIRNGELGESYKDGIFHLLEAGRHKLPANHRFVKKVSVNTDIVDLEALMIVTVKEGQVAVINTESGVIIKGAGKHQINRSEGNYFQNLVTTSPQGVSLPPLMVMCSDQIEMRAESMLIYKVDEPLKTVGLGIDKIVGYLSIIADGTLRTILSRFSSSDIAPSLHTDEEHHTSKRNDRLVQLHDECVVILDKKAQEWGLRVTDLQITQILPADDVYLATIRNLGSQQSTAEANRRLAENKAQIAQIEAKAEESRVVSAQIEQQEAVVRAETDAQTKKIQAEAEAAQTVTRARAEATATGLMADADANRIRKLSDAAKDASPITQQVMRLEAEAKILEKIPNPVFVQPGLGDTSIYSRDQKNRLTMFTTKRGQESSVVLDALSLQSLGVTRPHCCDPVP